MGQPVIIVDSLEKAYGESTVVGNVSFTVEYGEVFGILGPNGAGKTTTLEMLEALRTIDSGYATIDGVDVASQPRHIKSIIGLQLQSSNFYDKLKLKELLSMFAGFYGQRIDDVSLLEEVELAHKADSYPEQLSGGQRQRFSVAVALVNTPKVMFLDEPTTGLDPQSRRHMWDLVERVRDKGITVVLTTHYMEEAEHLCDRVAIMDEGSIAALDTPKQLIQQLDRGFEKPETVQQADLEDVFIDLTGKELRE